jgi:hypothetical protein
MSPFFTVGKASCPQPHTIDLRAHPYEALDQVARTEETIETVRKVVELRLMRKPPKQQTANSKQMAAKTTSPKTLPKLIVGDPDDIIHIGLPCD